MTMDKDTETSEERSRLRDIEPLRPVDESEPTDKLTQDADRVGMTTAAAMSSTPAVGVAAEADESPPKDDDGLEALRR
jgi:hypothetical protein